MVCRFTTDLVTPKSSQSFVELYRDNCLYTMLADQVRDYIDDPDSVSFPEIPEKGDLDLEDVLRSQYCFL